MSTKRYLAQLAQSVAEVAEGVRETNLRLVTLTAAMNAGFTSVNERIDALAEQFVRHTHDGSGS